jgi:hypothetical protein
MDKAPRRRCLQAKVVWSVPNVLAETALDDKREEAEEQTQVGPVDPAGRQMQATRINNDLLLLNTLLQAIETPPS